MEQFLDIVLLLLSAVMIIFILLQGGKAEGASGAITGGNMRLFTNIKERGAEKRASQITLIVGMLFFAIVIAIHLI